MLTSLRLVLLLATAQDEVWCPGKPSSEFPHFHSYESTAIQLDPEVYYDDPLYKVEHLYDCEKMIYRFVLRSRSEKDASWVLRDTLDIQRSGNEWVEALTLDCLENRDGESADEVIALLTGYANDYRVAKAWRVSRDGRKFMKIEPKTVTCTLDAGCPD